MECSFGITDFVLLASDTTAGRSIIQFKSDENKIKVLGPHLAMAYGGEPGDTNNFADFVDRNFRLYHIRSIRSRRPYSVNLLLAGYDTTTSLSHLYWIDYLGTKASVPYAAHGLGMYVALSTMDKWWKADIGAEDGLSLLRMCIDETKKRLTVKFAFNCILIDANGTHHIDLEAADPLEGVRAAAAAAEAKAQAAAQAASETAAPAEASAVAAA